MLTLHIPTARSPVEGLSHQTLGTQHLLPPLWALAVPSAGLVQSVRCWPGHQELWLLGLSCPWPLSEPSLSLAIEQGSCRTAVGFLAALWLQGLPAVPEQLC